ncbi:hypothetical protein [Sulfurimonas sp.]
MKIYLIILILTILFNGCAHKSAFEDFNLTKKQELSEDVLRSLKIEKNGVVEGIITALYLNNIDKVHYKNNEFFYIYMYTTDQNSSISFLLNSKKAINIEQLQNPNKFTHLTNVDAKWLKYYLIEFKKEVGNLKFQIVTDNNTSNVLLFKQEE